MAGPQNAIIGDEVLSDLPVSQIPEQDLTAERNAAKFSRTKEYQILKSHLEDRIKFYQSYMPSGAPVLTSELSVAELGARWQVANAIITELRAIIAAYEQAREAVENARSTES